MHKWWANLDLVSIWKACSIALAGAFGMLGLLTEFKDKHKNITKWGWISLVGIIVTTVLGVAAQLKESKDDAAKALKLATTSSNTLTNIERLLSPLNGAHYTIAFELPCATDTYEAFCKAVGKDEEEELNHFIDHEALERRHWAHWKGGRLCLSPRIDIFRDRSSADQFLSSSHEERELDLPQGDLSVRLSEFCASAKMLDVNASGKGKADLSVIDAKPQFYEQASNGKIQGLPDLPGATVVITEEGEALTTIVPKYFGLLLDNGQTIRFAGSFQRSKSADGETLYSFIFPQK